MRFGEALLELDLGYGPSFRFLLYICTVYLYNPVRLIEHNTLLTVKAASVDIDDPNPFRRRVQVPVSTGRALGTFTVIVRGQPSLSLDRAAGVEAQLSSP